MTPPITTRPALMAAASLLAAIFAACLQAVAAPLYPAYVAPAVEEGSALDASFLLHAPAGRHGHTVSRGGELLFADGTSARFWGVNLAWEAQYPREEQVEGIVRRLRAHGINMVRLTYLDSPPPRGLLRSMTPTALEVDSEQLARLDRLAAALMEGGIYLTVCLMMGGPVADVAPGVDLQGRHVSAPQMINPGVIAAHERFAEFLLNHQNPHTGGTWGEEPGIAVVEVYNEGDPFYLRRTIREAPPELLESLHEQWRAWLREQGREGPREFDLACLDGRDEAAREAVRFFSGMQETHGARMRDLLRRCGYRGVICDTAGGAYSPAARWAQRDADIKVAHYYHDHLQTGEGRSWIRNLPGCASDFRALLVAAWERDPSRPYILGEWDFCWPNEYRAEGVPAMAAFAAMQGWAGALQFTYWSQSWDDMEQYLGEGGRIRSIWRIMSDPAVMALYPAAAMMFLRGDVSVATELVSPPVDAYTVRNWPPTDPRAFLHRYGTTLHPEPPEPAAQQEAPRLTVSDTGEIRFDRDAGVLVVDTPRSQAVIGMAGGRRVETADVVFELDNPFAVVTVSSLTQAPIATSERLLVTTVARAQNTGFQFTEEEGRHFIRAHGQGPVMAEAVTGRLIFRGREGLTAYALEPTGARRGEGVVVPVEGGAGLDLTASGPAMHYEVIRETTREAPAMEVRHPNLFLNPHEIAAMRRKVETVGWARDLYQGLLERVETTLTYGDRPGGVRDPLYGGPWDGLTWSVGLRMRDVALAYAITGEERYAAWVREVLLRYAGDFRAMPDEPGPGGSVPLWSREGAKWDVRGFGGKFGMFTPGIGGINLCWAYDLVHDTLSADERSSIRQFLRDWGHAVMGFLPDHPWGMNNCTFWGVAFCGVVGYTVGDAELVDFAIESPSGLKHQLEHMVLDGALWAEAPVYDMYYISSAMAALAEAALRYDGTDLWQWESPSGHSMRNFYDACLALAFPVDLRVANWGDFSSQSAFVTASAIHTGLQAGDTFLVNDRDGRDWNKYELAWLRYRDPAYAWVLAQNPQRDHYDQALWGLLALSHGEPLDFEPDPPDARSSILPDTGTAMLRAEEGPSYWSSPSPAAVLRFGPWVNHGHADQFHLTFHGMGTLLYPDWFIQWDYMRHERNLTPWSKHTAAHNTVMVDWQNMPRRTRSLDVVEHDFGEAVKVIRVSGSVYEGVTQTRTLALTREYLLDIFSNTADRERTFDWLLRGLGELNLPGTALEPYDLGADLGFGVIDSRVDDPSYRWIINGAAAPTGEDWSAVWTQEDGVGVRLTMLGVPGTTVYRGDTRDYVGLYGFSVGADGKVHGGSADGKRRFVPMVMARRQGPEATYIALHVPFAEHSVPEITVRETLREDGLRALEATGPGWVDTFIHADDTAARHEVTVPAGSVVFSGGFAYLRVQGTELTTQGQLEGIRLNRNR